MADYSDLTPEQLMMLRQFGGLLSSGNLDAYQAKQGNDNFSTTVRGFNAPAAQQGSASFALGAQISDQARLNAILNAASLSSRQGDSITLTPALAAQIGNLQAMYGQSIVDGDRKAQIAGAGYNFGPVAANIQRTFTDQGPNMTAYGVSVPTEAATFSANMLRGKGAPTSYQGQVEIPGLLGGKASAVAEYSPKTKDKAVYARWKREF